MGSDLISKCDQKMTMQSFKIAFAFALILLLGACGSDKAELEKKRPDESNKGTKKVSIAYLRSLYIASPVLIDEEIEFEGRVISHDRYGQFYKTIVVEDESGGIEIRADKELLCEVYGQFEWVKVKCNSLILGSYGGHLELGVKRNEISNSVDPIPEHLLRSIVLPLGKEKPIEIAPATLSIEELTSRYLSCYIELENVQFVEQELKLSWSESESDTNRHIVDRDGSKLIVRTSRNADFAQKMLPIGSGLIGGVLSYFNGEYQLIITQSEHAVMNSPRFDYSSSSVKAVALNSPASAVDSSSSN